MPRGILTSPYLLAAAATTDAYAGWTLLEPISLTLCSPGLVLAAAAVVLVAAGVVVGCGIVVEGSVVVVIGVGVVVAICVAGVGTGVV